MPYIPPNRRDILDDKFVKEVGRSAEGVGELTYVLYRIAIEYAASRDANGDYRFMDIAEVIAAFECAKLEFMRKISAPYEDSKIVSNGDVVARGR